MSGDSGRRTPAAGAGDRPASAARQPRSELVRFEDVHDRAARYMSAKDLRRVQSAYVFCAKAHEGQSRLSGEPYLVHPLAVAAILAGMQMDPPTVIAGLLHDVLEDTATGRDDLAKLFGDEVAHVVDGVTKLSKLAYSTKEEAQAESFRKMLLAMADDLRVIIVKLADRLHNMRTLGYLSPAKQAKVASETREIYSPIAHRLGMGRMKQELQELSFRHAEPERYEALAAELEQRRGVEEGFIRRTEGRLGEIMSAAGLDVRINGRRKSLAPIQRKLDVRKIGIEEIYDYLAFRIITGSVQDCYAALGVIHAQWTPIPARFKDFIATPKPNGYRSLHTTVVSESSQPFEVQIRTEDMHLVADQGVAAHWGYKDGQQPSAAEAARFAWLRNLVDAQRDFADPHEFMQAVKLDLYGDEVYCFTPQGEVKVLPAGSTPIDFAYSIHTEVGHRCIGAKIDGAMVALRRPLEHGNRVTILTSPGGRPRRDWLAFVQTSRARSKIRSWFNARDRAEAIEIGRNALEREARRVGRSAKKLLQSKDGQAHVRQLGYRDQDELLLAIAHERLRPAAFLLGLGFEPAPGKARDPAEPVAPSSRRKARRRRSARSPVLAGEEGLLVYLARCCSPVRGEEIAGYVTRGRGVSVHRKDCRNVRTLAEEEARLIPVSWNPAVQAPFEVRLRVEVDNRPGMLGDVTGALSALETNIRHATARTISSRKGLIGLTVEIDDVEHLERIRRAIQDIQGVRRVLR